MVKYLGREVKVLRDAKMGDAYWGSADDMVLVDYEGDLISVSKLKLEDYEDNTPKTPEVQELPREKKHKKV